jgi:malonate-semialdehyde dehydrogenase (acetylating)/methylmalonate-semialdehyde dehydrogenase
MRQVQHFIDGSAFAGESKRRGDVFNPATGEVDAQVALASASDLDAAVRSATAAQPGWAATNPQRRARVLMRFVELLNRNMQPLAELMSREHGKTVADSVGDVTRGLEVAEFCIGIAHLQKGEFVQGAGPGIDM